MGQFGVGEVVRVGPDHVRVVVFSEGRDEVHTLVKGIASRQRTAEFREPEDSRVQIGDDLPV